MPWLKTAALLLLMSAHVAICFSCRKTPAAPNDTPESLMIAGDSYEIYVGGQLQLHAEVRLADGSFADVTDKVAWSNTPALAGRIEATGRFVANSGHPGTETVNAEYRGLSAFREIEVTRRALFFALEPAIPAIRPGEDLQFRAIANYSVLGDIRMDSRAFVNEQTIWEIEPGIAAQIDDSGLLTAHPGASGTETVIARFRDLADSSVVTIGENVLPDFHLVHIPAGRFIMGDSAGSQSEQPEHEVFVRDFDIGKYEVTNRQFVRFLNEAYVRNDIVIESSYVFGRRGRFAGFFYLELPPALRGETVYIEVLPDPGPVEGKFRIVPGFEEYPVTRVYWYGAMAFCDYYGLRLPTEAQWERAARAGLQLDYPTADGTITHELANYAGTAGLDNFQELAPVGVFPPNAFGLYDMAGNVAEILFDVYSDSYYANSPPDNPMGPGPAMPIGGTAGLFVMRGGGAFTPADRCRSAARGTVSAFAHGEGFRVAR